MRRAKGFLITSALALSIAAEPALSQDKQHIFRRSNDQSTSTYLGVTAIPVSVTVNGTTKFGIYVTSEPTGGAAGELGLTTGAVLLTIGNHSIETVAAADAALAGRRAGPLDYSYVPWSGERAPQIVSRRIEFKGASQSANPPPYKTPAGAAGSSRGQQASDDQLEQHCIELINASRATEGVGRVDRKQQLSSLARSYAQYMLKNKAYYLHPAGSPHGDLEGRGPMERARQSGINYEVHENLGMESLSTAPAVQLIDNQHNKMMSEPPNQHNHRGIILDVKARSVGVGVASDGSQVFLVEEFGYE